MQGFAYGEAFGFPKGNGARCGVPNVILKMCSLVQPFGLNFCKLDVFGERCPVRDTEEYSDVQTLRLLWLKSVLLDLLYSLPYF